MEDWLGFLTDEELIVQERKWIAELKLLQSKINKCSSIRIAIDAASSLLTAQAAINRAKNGTCTKGVGDCPVHQMGSCKNNKL